MSEIDSLTLDIENPKARRDLLSDQLSTQYDAMLNAFLPFIPYLTLRSAQVVEVVVQSQSLLQDTRLNYENTLSYVADQEKEIEGIVSAAEQAAAKIGVAKFALNFENIANAHKDSSDMWLKVSGILGVASLAVTMFLIYLGPIWPAPSVPAGMSYFPFVLTKIVLISMLYFVTIWSARNYNAHRHLNVVNAHRQNALATFETFVKGTEDPATKDAVLLEAARCIFSPTTTGYLGKQPAPPASNVVEIIKRIGSTED